MVGPDSLRPRVMADLTLCCWSRLYPAWGAKNGVVGVFTFIQLCPTPIHLATNNNTDLHHQTPNSTHRDKTATESEVVHGTNWHNTVSTNSTNENDEVYSRDFDPMLAATLNIATGLYVVSCDKYDLHKSYRVWLPSVVFRAAAAAWRMGPRCRCCRSWSADSWRKSPTPPEWTCRRHNRQWTAVCPVCSSHLIYHRHSRTSPLLSPAFPLHPATWSICPYRWRCKTSSKTATSSHSDLFQVVIIEHMDKRNVQFTNLVYFHLYRRGIISTYFVIICVLSYFIKAMIDWLRLYCYR